LYSEFLGPDWQEQELAKECKSGEKISKRCTVIANHASPLDTWIMQCLIPDSCGAYAAVGKLFEFWNFTQHGIFVDRGQGKSGFDEATH
jgi:1-acyl-sn-glycerol-3-phosphate acyltransferase